MGQIINSPASVCLSVCHLSYGRNSHSILMKLYTIDRNPNSKNPFIGGKNPPSPISPQFFTPVMHFQWIGLNTTVTWPVERLWRFMAQRTHLGGRYTGRGVAPTRHARWAPAPPPHRFPFLHPFLSSSPLSTGQWDRYRVP